jgi:hypothetical protein
MMARVVDGGLLPAGQRWPPRIPSAFEEPVGAES